MASSGVTSLFHTQGRNRSLSRGRPRPQGHDPRQADINNASAVRSSRSRTQLSTVAITPSILSSPRRSVLLCRHQISTTAGGAVGPPPGEEAEADKAIGEALPKFTFTAGERQLVRELFLWLVEPCLAFLRREISEMVSC